MIEEVHQPVNNQKQHEVYKDKKREGERRMWDTVYTRKRMSNVKRIKREGSMKGRK